MSRDRIDTKVQSPRVQPVWYYLPGASPLVTRSPRMQSELHGQTVVVIGGTSGIGLETARRARAEGAQVILTARNPKRLEEAARDIDALSSAAFDATDFEALRAFFLGLRKTSITSW